MALAVTPKVEIRFGIGAGFGNVLILGSATDGTLGTNVLGSATTQFVDISNKVSRISTRRGRDRIFESFNAGQASIEFNDANGHFNPDNALSPYYGKIAPMCQVRISATYSGVKYYLFTGFVTGWDWSWDPGVNLGRVTINATDGFHLLNLVDVATVAGAIAGETTGSRLNRILTAARWPLSQRMVSAGTVTVQADPGTSRPALQAAQTIEATENGAFFMDESGYATFLDYKALATKGTATPIVFNDNGTDIAYQAIDVSLDEAELANQVTVSRVGGTDQTVSDSASIEKYYLRSFSRSDLMMQTDNDALGQARSLLNAKKEAELRVDSIGIDISQVSNRVIPGLSLSIGSPVTVYRRYAGTTIQADLSVQGINHDITPDRWFTTFSTAKRLTGFILNSAQFGVLGTSTL